MDKLTEAEKVTALLNVIGAIRDKLRDLSDVLSSRRSANFQLDRVRELTNDMLGMCEDTLPG